MFNLNFLFVLFSVFLNLVIVVVWKIGVSKFRKLVFIRLKESLKYMY